jgi:ubiquinone/menaquinone biosynthesis C-methylase UbiE
MVGKINKHVLKDYYAREALEEDRLYDFTKPYSYYFDRKRMELTLRFVKNYVTSNCLFLDVGCGDGSYLRHIDCKYAVGLDISKSKLLHARRKMQSQKHDFIEADAEYLPFKNSSLDIVLSTELIEHVVDPISVLKEISRVCKSQAIISTPTQNSLWRLLLHRLRRRKKYGPTHIREFCQEELVQLLKENKLYVSHLRGSPILDFPLIWLLLKSLQNAKALSKLDSLIDRLPYLRQYGVFVCVMALKG